MLVRCSGQQTTWRGRHVGAGRSARGQKRRRVGSRNHRFVGVGLLFVGGQEATQLEAKGVCVDLQHRDLHLQQRVSAGAVGLQQPLDRGDALVVCQDREPAVADCAQVVAAAQRRIDKVAQ